LEDTERGKRLQEGSSMALRVRRRQTEVPLWPFVTGW
jgi:hypothetical protein